MTLEDARLSVVGKPLPRVGAASKATGQAKYTDDLTLPGTLHAKLLRSIYPHALVKSVDVSRAESIEGVKAVITGKDLPTKYGIMPTSEDETALAVDKVRYVGEPVAAVAATDPEVADEALKAIQVEYEPLPSIFSVEKALSTSEPRIHDYGHAPNIQRMASLEFGNVQGGFSKAEYVREDTFFYAGSNHLSIEEHSALASYGPDGRLTLWSSTQVPHYLHKTLANVLGLPPQRVRVSVPEVGGGFGAKTDIFSHEIAASKLSMVTRLPVKITCTREEVFYLHRGRHPTVIWLKSGFTRDGRLTAVHIRTALDGGAYGSYGSATTYYTGALLPATYRIPSYKFEGLRAFTNKPPCGPKRGHGTPQPRFAMECQMDKAAEALGLDPTSIRLRNAVKPFSKTVNHLRITSCGLEDCIRKVAEASGFEGKRGKLGKGRGVGFAVGSYLSGAGLPIYWNDMPHSGAEVKVDRGGEVTVYCMATDIGQGSTSVITSIAAEVLGIDQSDVQAVTADTDLTPVDLGSYSSRVTFMAGNAVLEASKKIRSLVFKAASERLGVPEEDLEAKGRRVYSVKDGTKSVGWPEAVRLAESKFGTLAAGGSYKPPKLAGPYKGSGVGPSPAFSYSACVAQVACDPTTGLVQVEEIWLAHDVGRAINPKLVEGQIEGGVLMGLSEALMEEQVVREGLVTSSSFLGYKVPTALDVPEIHSIIVETIDPEGPFGAKEAGQGPLLPVAPAIANAVYDALGVRVDEVPITPDKVLKAMESKAKKEPQRKPRTFPTVQFPEPTNVAPPDGFDRPVTNPPAGRSGG
ncbi:MAG: molybdopterin-dependent oxidoreductase [Nitrososphaerota archaeon]|nr:molybdopterin-dependent oxidoreductase [Nitrososphaerota archaeon]